MPKMITYKEGNQVSKDGYNLLVFPYESEEIQDCPDELKKIALDHHHLYEEDIVINTGTALNPVFLILFKKQTAQSDELEYLRRVTVSLQKQLGDLRIQELRPYFCMGSQHIYAFVEGLFLSSYLFEKYLSKQKKKKDLQIVLQQQDLLICKNIPLLAGAVAFAKDWVNEPANVMNSQAVAKACEKLAQTYPFNVEVLSKKKIESLKMGGLMAVNAGSDTPPVFIVLSYKPGKAVNKRPVVLIGKGVTYDTGGLSLKPTPNSMDQMKSDLAGAATVVGALQAIADLKTQLEVIVLLPVTDNRLSSKSIAPGDVIEMADQTTVEVVNTDAEGRLILADALIYARRFDPELVIDMATLTGSASRAIGREGMVMMGTAHENHKQIVKELGLQLGERVVEFPLWEDYASQIRSSIADLKNLGGDEAGAITAGKFLEHFVHFPWLHFDIAGVAFSKTSFYYHGEGGTGIGVRLLTSFLIQYCANYGATKSKKLK
jgi:leucyl aminopeptidase